MTWRKQHSLLVEAGSPDPCSNERQENEQFVNTKDRDVAGGLQVIAECLTTGCLCSTEFGEKNDRVWESVSRRLVDL
jgi:hypothetical protein